MQTSSVIIWPKDVCVGTNDGRHQYELIDKRAWCRQCGMTVDLSAWFPAPEARKVEEERGGGICRVCHLPKTECIIYR
jgi:hypothetical protein